MSRKFIAFVLASAIAVTGFTAAPARAGEKEIATIIAGVAALAIIAKTMDNRDKHKARPQHVDRRVVEPPHHDYYRTPYGHPQPRAHHDDVVVKKVITRRGNTTIIRKTIEPAHPDWRGSHRIQPRPLPDRVARGGYRHQPNW